MSRRKKSKGPPKVQQMGYSGVAKKDLAKFKKWLESVGATDIKTSLDEDTMVDFPDEGEFYIVDYRR